MRDMGAFHGFRGETKVDFLFFTSTLYRVLSSGSSRNKRRGMPCRRGSKPAVALFYLHEMKAGVGGTPTVETVSGQFLDSPMAVPC